MCDKASSIKVEVTSFNLFFLQIRVSLAQLFELFLQPLKIPPNLLFVDFDVLVQVFVLIPLVDRVEGHQSLFGLHRQTGCHSSTQILGCTLCQSCTQNAQVAAVGA